MTFQFTYIIVIIVLLIGIIVTVSYIYKEQFSDIQAYPDYLKTHLPNKIVLDSNSANNVQTFIKNKDCNARKFNDFLNDDKRSMITRNKNQDCNLNPEYLHSMCLLRRDYNKKRLCNNITGITQYPQNTSNPENFHEF